jgi:hypothetical protein
MSAEDHRREAERYLDLAADRHNRALREEARDHQKQAQVHATLAVAQGLDRLLGHVEEKGIIVIDGTYRG